MKRISFAILKNLPAKEKQITFSTGLTLTRLLLLPFLIGAMIFDHWYFAFVIFAIAAFTDVADGWLARYMDQQTFLGAALDTVVDKIMMITIFSTLLFIQPFLFRIPAWFVLLVLIKELIQIGGAAFIFFKNGYLEIKPTVLGKLNGVVQTAFITWLFSCYFFNWAPIKTYFAMLASVTSVILITFLDYLRIGYSYIRS